MSEVRAKKLVALVQGLVAKFFTLHHDEWGIDDMVLVDDVFASSDLKNIDIWVSFSPHEEKRAQKNYDVLVKHMHELNNYLFANLNAKRMPKVHIKLANPAETFKMLDLFATLEDRDKDARDSQADTDDDSSSQ